MANLVFRRDGMDELEINVSYENNILTLNDNIQFNFVDIPVDQLNDEWILQFLSQTENPVSKLLEECPQGYSNL